MKKVCVIFLILLSIVVKLNVNEFLYHQTDNLIFALMDNNSKEAGKMY